MSYVVPVRGIGSFGPQTMRCLDNIIDVEILLQPDVSLVGASLGPF
jgi:hypothetical protein